MTNDDLETLVTTRLHERAARYTVTPHTQSRHKPTFELPKSRERRRVLIPFAAAIALITAGFSWGFITQTSETTQLTCPIGIIDAVTSNPVNDCATAYRHERGTIAPRLIAYDNGQGGVHASDRAVLELRPLSTGSSP